MSATKDWLTEAAERAAGYIDDDIGAACGPGANTERMASAIAELERVKAAVLLLPRLAEALTKIAEGAGPYSRDPLTHAENCIEAMKETARALLAEVERVKGETGRG